MADGTADELRGLYNDLGVSNAAFRPRLETVLDALTEVYGYAGLADVLSDLVDPPPNRHHHFFARHLLAGGAHITANFDTCIERVGGPDVQAVFHFHGRLSADGDLSVLGARLGAIENGFKEAVVTRLDEIIFSDSVELLVFVGYSGSDFFDATPYLLSRWDALGRHRILWLDYSSGPLERAPAASSNSSNDLIRRFVEFESRQSGPSLTVFRGTLDEFLPVLSDGWVMPSPDTPMFATASEWRPEMETSESLRREATVALYAKIGYRKGVMNAFKGQAPKMPSDWLRLADAAWGAGRYSLTRAAWLNAYPADSLDGVFQRIERIAAYLWIRGEYLLAQSILWKAIRLICNDGSGVSPATVSMLLETYGRVIEHMRRFPDSRLSIRGRRIGVVVNLLNVYSSELPVTQGLALRIRLANLTAALTGKRDDNLEWAIESFSESEALHSWLNFEHARLRRLGSESTNPPDLHQCYLLQSRRQERLGATADAARVRLLPRAMAVFTPWDAIRAFAPVEMSRWHRIRIVGGLSLLWAVEKVSAIMRGLKNRLLAQTRPR